MGSLFWNHSQDRMRSDLRQAVTKCQQRGLYHSAKWAAQQLNGLVESKNDDHAARGTSRLRTTPGTTRTSTGNNVNSPNTPSPIYADDRPDESPMSDKETDRFLLARTYFDTKEFGRAAEVLKECSDAKSVFLRLYSKYLFGEQNTDEDLSEPLRSSDGKQPANRELPSLAAELAILHKLKKMDGFLLYLYGLILNRLDQKVKASEILIQSITQYEFCWSAWQELASCFPPQETQSYMLTFFKAHLAIELSYNSENGSTYLEELSHLFPRSRYIKGQMALAKYNTREFEDAERVCEEMFTEEPHSLDHLDNYSNVLYVLERKAKLGFLAHAAVQIDRFRPETCVILGNYFSSRLEHEKAVLYFRRALKLNRRYLIAWTLMGHEYMELKNTASAIEAYRRGVDINNRDFRNWYGLGQSYQIMRMPYFALYYYQRASALQPFDSRICYALAEIYETLSRPQDAIRCYKAALSGSESISLTLLKIAQLYSSIRDDEAAAHYHELCLEEERQASSNGVTASFAESALFLARFYKNQGRLQQAEAYALAIESLEEGRTLVKEIQALRQAGTL
ncbi:anaphase-promoting complex component apc8 [Gonapodya sp. JEL0774]|nr:anaphase-promoting complex component apc8 [Gonapodya sp. JEL0774]